MAAPAVAGHEHRVGAPPGAQPSGVYRPRRPRASPLYGLLDRRFRHLSLVYDERFDGPTAGTQTLDPLEFLARLLTHIPDPGQVMTRYYGWYASRTRGTRARLASDGRRLTADDISVEEPVAITEPVNWSLRAARYRWAELLRRIYEVDPLACPRCAAPMRIVAVITDPAVITRILVHRARSAERARQSRSPPPARRRSSALATGGPPR